MRIHVVVACAFASLLLAVPEVLAADAKQAAPSGGEFAADLVTAYSTCVKPNSVTKATSGVPLPTCIPARRIDLQCGYSPTGKGRMTARAIKSDVQIDATLSGLAGCDRQ